MKNFVPFATADVMGDTIRGTVKFYNFQNGTIVVAEIGGLPDSSPFYGFHIHGGDSCDDGFSRTGEHFAKSPSPHPYHSGDLPPLLNANGSAWLAVFTDRFTPSEVLGKVVVIHDSVDDFTTQPAGNSGKKIACGKITINNF